VASLLHDVTEEVLRRVTPSEDEKQKVHALAEALVKKVKQETERRGVKAEIRVEGSVAKDTWLRDCPEVDVFIRVPPETPREHFGTLFMEISRNVTEGHRQIERFAEHPYLEAVIDDVTVNIVPCYKVKQGKWLSATDRTPFHTDYVKPRLDQQKCQEVRLLKRFMKGIGVYGAEIKIGGFSGYLCELLILNYGSFTEVLKSATEWKEQTVIDPAKHYKHRGEAAKLFGEPFVMVDPVDKQRNVAAAVKKERFYEFIAASRQFLKSPNIRFFYPPKRETLKLTELTERIKSRGTAIVALSFSGVDAVPDVLWGQLFRSQKALRKLIEQHQFKVLRDTAWSNEKELNVFIFELEHRILPAIKRHMGPPISKKEDCERFLRKHLGAESTLSGPRIEDGCWVVEVKRKHTDVAGLLKQKLKDSKEEVGLPEQVSRAVSETVNVSVNSEVTELYKSSREFAEFFTEYLEGKPKWLT